MKKLFQRLGSERWDRIMFRVMRLVAHTLARGRLRIAVKGLDHVPSRGPAILVARHYHHLFDGIALHWAIPRRIHLLVTLDWATRPLTRYFMAAVIRAARWPVVLRQDALARQAQGAGTQGPGAFTQKDLNRYRRKAVHDSMTLLREGRLLVIFPEGYPNVDPHYTPKTGKEEMLPFKSGFASIAAAAETRLGGKIPLIPVGIRYTAGEPWIALVNFGAPNYAREFSSRDLLVEYLERQVRLLSGLSASAPLQPLG
ncbi:MAG: lysophospholipid acyltransferase family protein [Deltaproteobacteria bacterium]